MELNKKNMKRIMLLITFALVLYWVLHNTAEVGNVFSWFTKLFSPFIIGLCLAFVLNLLLNPLERGWTAMWKNSKSAAPARLKRPVCLVLSVIIFIGVISIFFFVLVPQLSSTVTGLYAALPSAALQIEQWWNKLSDFLASHGIYLPVLGVDFDTDQIVATVRNFLATKGEAIFGGAVNITISIFSLIINIILAFVCAMYVLATKEKLGRNSKKLMYAVFGDKAADRTMELLTLTSDTFSNFVTGQVTEAFILGSLCFIGMTILRMPYALVVSVVICFTALVPIFGAWIGALLGAFLIVFVSPVKALTFLIFLLILQQVEGNLIYPKVVGKSVGLPGLWVLVAVTIGGSAFGVMGMLFGVPICSIIYTLTTEFVRAKDPPAPEPAPAAPPEASAQK